MYEDAINNAQQQATAAWINFLNLERLRRMVEQLSQQDLNCEAAIKELAKIYKNSPYFKRENTLIFACSADKDYKKMSRILNPLFKNIVVTEASKSAVSAKELKKYFPSAQICANRIHQLPVRSPEHILLSSNVGAFGAVFGPVIANVAKAAFLVLANVFDNAVSVAVFINVVRSDGLHGTVGSNHNSAVLSAGAALN